MKVFFDSAQEAYTKSNINAPGHTAKQAPQAKEAKTSAGFFVQMSGENSGLVRNATYDKQQLTMEELSEKAGLTNTDLQQMYMTVMANNTSPEEFGKMLEDGYQIADLDVETVVTILDQIKVSMMQGGAEIQGFTDTLDQTTLEEVLGNKAYAEALKEPISENAVAYMVQNDLQPTAENLWKAKYSVGNDYEAGKGNAVSGENAKESAKESAGDSWKELADKDLVEEKWQDSFHQQMQQIIVAAGLEVNDQTRAGAEFLVKHDIPLTTEKLELYLQVSPFGKQIPEQELVERIQKQISDGQDPLKVNLSVSDTIYEKAVSMQQDVAEISDDAILETIEKDQPLNLRHLKQNQKAVYQADKKTAIEDYSEKELAFVSAKRQLEEIRLHMTVEANLKLLRSGYQIDTVPLEKLVEELKQLEEKMQTQGVVQAEKATEVVRQLSWMPADALGKVVAGEIPFTVGALHEQGEIMQKDYDKVLRDYETMQTQPRADLGDSIKKAFRNVDEILTGMGKEPSEENRRAVRILGYNSLEITEENLERALSVDAEIQTLFARMKPGKVLQMIREGVDPLQTTIPKLNTYLEEKESEFSQQAESYSRFLYELDQKGDITPEERESYIGVYRLLHQIEKSDGRATGFLLANEAEATLENLLTGVRSAKRGQIDYKMDDSFAGVSSKWLGTSIVDQIQAVKNAKPELEFLQEYEQPVTLSNLAAATGVLQEEIEEYKKYLGEREEIVSAEEKLLEQMTGKEQLTEGFADFAHQVQQVLTDQLYQPEMSGIQIREMQNLWKQVRLKAALTKEDYYQLPLHFGEEVAMVNLRIRYGQDVTGAEVSMETEAYGRLEAVLEENREGDFMATLYYEKESPETIRLLQEVKSELLEKSGSIPMAYHVKEGNITIKQGEKHSPEKHGMLRENHISSRELFQMAKIFIQSIRNNM